ncbi:MAG TPA: type VI secretion system membrane subunit TssM [Planctomycetota bacterium]|nr:type VI secretion system membrane subunit TssM [Planctomycetota bacterium]
MAMLKKLLGLLLRPPLPQVMGLVLLTAVILVAGRAFRRVLGLKDPTLYAICAGVWLLAGLVFVWRRLQARKRAQLIEDRLRGQAREHKEAVRPDRRHHVEALEKQLNDALGALKSSKMGKSALYALPWYVIIGPPGSGKTTLLRESGLSFPQMTHGRGLRGVGGTRNCDWWFTDSGILLDTAGRYTTQAEDRDEWLSFLDMLKKARVQKPINGALIAISTADVLQANEEQLAEHARKIRERLAELTERLELVFPVYLLFTKCDLLDGFVEMFGSYSKKERAQVWGFTLPYLTKDPEPVADRFRREFDALHERLCAERLHNLGGAKSQQKKRKIFSFPLQFTLAREHLRTFVEQLVQPNPYHESSDVRGFYFTSGTQEGKPLDQILRTMRLASGLQTDSEAPTEAEVEKKAYFIDELFTQIVFPDQDLARSSAKAQQRRRLLQRVALITTAAATFLLTIVLFVAYAGQANLIDRCKQVYADTKDLTRERAPIDAQKFERLRELFVQLDAERGQLSTYLLGQTNYLYERRIRPLYVDKLKTTFLEPCAAYLEGKLVTSVESGKPSEDELKVVSDRLKVFSMLQGERNLDREGLRNLMVRDTLWTWKEIGRVEDPACMSHLDTFLGPVVGAGLTDWQVTKRPSLVMQATELIDTKDLSWLAAKAVIDQKQKSETQRLDAVLRQPGADKQLNPVLEIPDWTLPGSVSADDLVVEGDKLGEKGGEKTREVFNNKARDNWKSVLADACKVDIKDLAVARRWLSDVTGPDSVVIGLYLETLTAVESFGGTVTNRDVDWLRAELTNMGKELEPELDGLLGRNMKEVVEKEAKDGGAFERLKMKLDRTRASFNRATDAASADVKDSIRTALFNLVGNVEFTVKYQVYLATAENWRQPNGLHSRLAGFQSKAPFASDVQADAVPLAEFTQVFSPGGSFEQAMKWIRYLQDNAWGTTTDTFAKTAGLAKAISDKCFAEGRAAITAEWWIQNRANASNTMVQLGSTQLDTRLRQIRGPFTWRIAEGARLGVEAMVSSVPKTLWIDDYKDRPWGLLLLLRSAVEKKPEQLDRPAFSYTFEFRDAGLRVSREYAEAKLVFVDIAGGPLDPTFFDHKFSIEVFVEPKR